MVAELVAVELEMLMKTCTHTPHLHTHPAHRETKFQSTFKNKIGRKLISLDGLCKQGKYLKDMITPQYEVEIKLHLDKS